MPEYFISTSISSDLKSCMVIGVITKPPPTVSTTRASVWRGNCILAASIQLLMLIGDFRVRMLWKEEISEGSVLHLILHEGTLQEEVLRRYNCSGTVLPRCPSLGRSTDGLEPFGCIAWAHINMLASPVSCHELNRGQKKQIWGVTIDCRTCHRQFLAGCSAPALENSRI